MQLFGRLALVVDRLAVLAREARVVPGRLVAGLLDLLARQGRLDRLVVPVHPQGRLHRLAEPLQRDVLVLRPPERVPNRP